MADAGVARFEEGEVALDVAGGARAARGGEADVGGHGLRLVGRAVVEPVLQDLRIVLSVVHERGKFLRLQVVEAEEDGNRYR